MVMTGRRGQHSHFNRENEMKTIDYNQRTEGMLLSIKEVYIDYTMLSSQPNSPSYNRRWVKDMKNSKRQNIQIGPFIL